MLTGKDEAIQAMMDALQVVILDDGISEYMIANDPMSRSQCMDAVKYAALMRVAQPTDSFIDAIRKEAPRKVKSDRADRLREIKVVDRETMAVRMRHGLDYLALIGAKSNCQFVATEGAVGDWAVYVETPASRDEGNGFEDICKFGAKVTQEEAEAMFPSWATLFKWRD